MTENQLNENPEEQESTEPANDKTENAESEILNDEPSRFQEFFADAVEIENRKLNDILNTFLELKKIDEELAEIDEEKGDLPDEIETIKSKLETISRNLEEKKDAHSKLTDEKLILEKENNEIEKKIDKYDQEKFNVRSNKEYDEIVKAIESLFDEVKKNEVRIKESGSLIEKLNEEISVLESNNSELSGEMSEKQTLLDELNEQYKQDEAELNEKRNNLFSKLDAQSGNLYERINSLYKGEATALVRKGNCSGCYNSIPPQRVIEIKTAEKIFTCQSCGRILVPEEIANLSH